MKRSHVFTLLCHAKQNPTVHQLEHTLQCTRHAQAPLHGHAMVSVKLQEMPLLASDRTSGNACTAAVCRPFLHVPVKTARAVSSSA